MEKQEEQKKGFDLTTHIRDAKGNIVKEQPYRLHIEGQTKKFERPPGSGWMYTEGGDLISKPSPEQIKEQQQKEFSNDQLLKQINELKAQLLSNSKADKGDAGESEVSSLKSQEKLVDSVDQNTKLDAALANVESKEIKQEEPKSSQAPKFNKQPFNR